jgi:anti-sigma B factor antagonist
MADETPLPVVAEFAQLDVHASVDDGTTRVELVGELDEATAPYLRQRLVDLVAALKSDVVLDIGFLSFLDPPGLALFVALHKRVAALGRRMVISSPTPRVARLFQITGLDTVLNIEPAP